jgi:hypothetical protein
MIVSPSGMNDYTVLIVIALIVLWMYVIMGIVALLTFVVDDSLSPVLYS